MGQRLRAAALASRVDFSTYRMVVACYDSRRREQCGRPIREHPNLGAISTARWIRDIDLKRGRSPLRENGYKFFLLDERANHEVQGVDDPQTSQCSSNV